MVQFRTHLVRLPLRLICVPGVKFLVSQFLRLTLMQFRFRFSVECANLHLAVSQLD
jgi:hypothetical protein